MRNRLIISVLALIFGAGLLLSSCTRTVYHSPRTTPLPRTVKKNPGPPPHAPAHGYRYMYGTTYLIYDSGLRVYRVDGHPGHYYYDGNYYRDGKDGWKICIITEGPWEHVNDEELPSGLKPKKYEKDKKDKKDKDNNGRGHAYGKDKDNWKDTGQSKYQRKRYDHPPIDSDTKKKNDIEDINIHPEADDVVKREHWKDKYKRKDKRKDSNTSKDSSKNDDERKGKPEDKDKEDSKGDGSKGKTKSSNKGKGDPEVKDDAKKNDKGKGKSDEDAEDVAEAKDDNKKDSKGKGKSSDEDKDAGKSKDDDKKDDKDKE